MGEKKPTVFDVIRDKRKEQFFRKVMDKPLKCPYCESDDLLPEVRSNGKGVMTISNDCMTCGKAWEEVYKLVDIREEEEK